MNTPTETPEEPRTSYTYDAIPEDEERQEELNRLMRKPGEPPYCPPVKKSETAVPQNGSASGEQSSRG
jgi:hypothetical protein